MYNILFFIAGIALGFYVKDQMKGSGKVKTFDEKSPDEMEKIRLESKEALTERTEKRKEKILIALKDSKGNFMSNDIEGAQNACVPKPFACADVEKLLDVSDTTARKYLNELEAENKIKQIGNTGQGVYYVLI